MYALHPTYPKQQMHQGFNIVSLYVHRWWGSGASACVLVIRRLVVCPRSILLASTIHSLSAGHQLAPTSATDWFNKGCVMHYHVYVIIHVKDP